MILLPMHGFYCIDFTHLQNLIGFIMQYKKIILLASSRKKLSVGMLDTTHTIGNIFFRILVSFEFHHWQQLLSDLWSDRLMSFIFEKMTAEYLRLNSYKFIKSSFKWKWCSFEGDGFSWAHNANVYTCTSRPLSFRAYFLWMCPPHSVTQHEVVVYSGFEMISSFEVMILTDASRTTGKELCSPYWECVIYREGYNTQNYSLVPLPWFVLKLSVLPIIAFASS